MGYVLAWCNGVTTPDIICLMIIQSTSDSHGTWVYRLKQRRFLALPYNPLPRETGLLSISFPTFISVVLSMPRKVTEDTAL